MRRGIFTLPLRSVSNACTRDRISSSGQQFQSDHRSVCRLESVLPKLLADILLLTGSSRRVKTSGSGYGSKV